MTAVKVEQETLRHAIAAEIMRQCSVGAGSAWEEEDTGLFVVLADLDMGALVRRIATAIEAGEQGEG